MDDLTVRKTPCATCPYRVNVPSGVWDESEYERLRKYDGDIADQVQQRAFLPFACHQNEDASELCAGWVGHREHPDDLLALRMHPGATQEVMDYTTDVELFPSGADAADHGMQDIETPSDRAVEAIDKIVRKRGL